MYIPIGIKRKLKPREKWLENSYYSLFLCRNVEKKSNHMLRSTTHVYFAALYCLTWIRNHRWTLKGFLLPHISWKEYCWMTWSKTNNDRVKISHIWQKWKCVLCCRNWHLYLWHHLRQNCIWINIYKNYMRQISWNFSYFFKKTI